MATQKVIELILQLKGDAKARKQLDKAEKELIDLHKAAMKAEKELKDLAKAEQFAAASADKLAGKSKKAAFGLHSMRVKTSGLRRKLGELRNVLLVFTFALAGTIRMFKGFVAAFIEQEKVEKQLETALGRNVDALKNYAAELQKLTIFGDEQILSGMALIGAFVREEEALKKATKATLDLAAAKGFDLRQAADLVGKTLGSTTNALSRYGIEVVGAVGSTERLESLVTNVDKAFGGMASSLRDTAGGAVKQMNDALGDLGETIGQVLAPAIIAISKLFRRAFVRMALDVQAFSGNITEIGKLQREIFDAVEQMKQLQKIGGTEAIVAALAAQVDELGRKLNALIDEINGINATEETWQQFMLSVVSVNNVLEEQKVLLEEAKEKAIEWAESAVVLHKEVEGVFVGYKNINEVIKSLHPANQALLAQAQGLADALAQAVIFGQRFGDAMVSALRAIAAEILSKLAIFLLLEAILPGAGVLGGAKGFVRFLGGGALGVGGGAPIGSSGLGKAGGDNITNINLSVNNLIGTDEAAVRDQLLPVLNRVMTNA